MTKALGVFLSIVFVLACWTLCNWLELAPRLLLPTPIDVARAGWVEIASGCLADHIAISMVRLAGGYLMGAAAGVVVGILVGWFGLVRGAVLPALEVLRPIPPLAWIPLAIIWFGIGEPSKLFLIAITAFFPIMIATYRGVQQIAPVLIRAAQSMDVGSARMMATVVFPASLPDIATGLRVGWTLAIAALVGAEMIAARSGLGFLIMDSMNNGRFDTVIFGILFLGVFSVFTDFLFQALLMERALRWHAGLERAQQ